MFKVNQKVVFVSKSVPNKLLITPSFNEVVTIKSRCSICSDSWDLVEYPIAKNGSLQSFSSYHLRPIDYTFGEKLAEEIQEEINQENLVNA